jgi:adenosylcobinamide-GDP ribazoletransferase
VNATRELRLFLVALQFYSRLPVTGRLAAWLGHDPGWLAPATRYFPLIGIVVAGLSATVYALCGLLLPHPVALVAAIAAGLMLTGAFHEDGFADYCDAMGGHHSRERLLEIMRDSRIGTYGAAGLLLMLLGRFEVLTALDPSWVGVSMICAAAASRGVAVLLMLTLPYLRAEESGIAKPLAQGVSLRDAGIALAIAVAPSVAAALYTGERAIFVAGLAAAVATAAWMRRRVRTRLGGYTGDCLGATQQLAEIAFLAAALALMALTPEGISFEIPGPDNLD